MMYVKPAAAVAVPFAVVTTTSTAPAACAGVVTVIPVDVWAVIVEAAPPNVTVVAPQRFAPVMVTAAPPSAEPAFGLTAVMVGAGTCVRPSNEYAATTPA